MRSCHTFGCHSFCTFHWHTSCNLRFLDFSSDETTVNQPALAIGRRRLSLRGLRTFCIAGRHLSFRVAAEELFVSASAVSHQIRALEQELKLPLFVRKAQSLELTEAGAMLYAEVDPLIRQIDAVTRGFCSRLRGQPLRISVQPFFASEMLLPRLPLFLEVRPDTDVHINTVSGPLQSHPAPTPCAA